MRRVALATGSRRCRRPTTSPTNPATCTCASRSAAAGSYAHLCTGDFDGFDRALDEVLELAGDDRRAGAGIVIGSPVAWATMAKGLVMRERGQLEEAEAQFDTALRIATEEGDPEIASWTRSNQALMLAMRGDLEAGDRAGRRNCELTERLGDVFSRSLALSNLGGAQIAAGDYAGALDSLEEAERVYRAAVSDGDEMETWRAGLRAEALIGVGRGEEALELAEWATEVARERGMLWSLPLDLQALAIARTASGLEGAGGGPGRSGRDRRADRGDDQPAKRSK